MLIDLTCPLELSKMEVLQDDRGRTRAYLDVLNLSKHTVRRALGSVAWTNSSGEVAGQTEITFEGLRLATHEVTQLKVASEFPEATSVQLRLRYVEFAGDVLAWTSDDSLWVELDFEPEPPGSTRGKLIRVAGKDALCYPEQFEGGWLCVCGRLNLPDSLCCVRCLRSREHVFTSLNRDAVANTDANWQEHFKTIERETRLEQQRRELAQRKASFAERKRRERRRYIAWSFVVGAIVVIALLAIAMLAGVMPNLFTTEPIPTPTEFVGDVLHNT